MDIKYYFSPASGVLRVTAAAMSFEALLLLVQLIWDHMYETGQLLTGW